MKNVDNFPPGWDEERVRRLIHHYETQTEAEAIAEDEAAFAISWAERQELRAELGLPAEPLPSLTPPPARKYTSAIPTQHKHQEVICDD